MTMDRSLPLALLVLLGTASICLTAYLMSWGGGSLGDAFVKIPSAKPVTAYVAGAKPLKCKMDFMNGSERVERRFVVPPARVAIRGWLVDTRNWTRPDPAMLRLVESGGSRVFEFEIGKGTSRGDVANHFEQPGVAMAGFESTVDMSRVPPGIYDIAVVLPRGVEKCVEGVSVEVRR
jgi:hypothetical protein